MFSAATKTDNVSSAANYIEDVFSTYLYTGNGKAQSINNGISIGSAVGGGAYFSGASDYLSLTPLSLSGDFTIEGWVWFRTTGSNPAAVGDLTGVNKQALRYLNGFNFYNNSGGGSVQGTIALTTNQWIHLAVSRVGSTTRIFTNGVLDGSVSDSGAFSVRNIGCISNGINMLDGYISNLRVLNGTGLYTSTFTVPTAPLTAITNTVLLICQSPSPFTDNSPSPNTITINGSPGALAYGGPISSTPAGSGGLVWIKGRSGATDHALYDTARGATFDLVSNSTAAQTTQTDGLISFNTNGFNVGLLGKLNTNAATYASWTFRKQAKFFDVVTFTKNASTNQRISHNLGATPGCIIVKSTDAVGSWTVWHRSLASATDSYLILNSTGAATATANAWGSTGPTSTDFGVSSVQFTNGTNYVAYLFAHDAGGFGATGSDNVISCGSYAGNGSATGPTVNLGYEPQWVLIKRATGGTGNWNLIDNMRGMCVGADDAYLQPNTSNAEAATGILSPTATGFQLLDAGSTWNGSGSTYIYIAIRRGPMKTPTSGTSVFGVQTTSSVGQLTSLLAPDTTISRLTGSANVDWNSAFFDRLRGNGVYLVTSAVVAEQTSSTVLLFNSSQYADQQISNSAMAWYALKRAPSFFDVVCYTGTGSGVTQTVSHNLTVAPEMIIVMARSAASDRVVWQSSFSILNRLRLNTTQAVDVNNTQHFGGTLPTSSVFYVGSTNNDPGTTYVAYLFATLAGITKVGSYTGTGALQTINCGFAAGARYVLIKRTDSTGDWWVYDSARGITSGNDPYFFFNTTAADVTNTNYVDTTSVGFQVTAAAPAGLNANGGTYIFLAIA